MGTPALGRVGIALESLSLGGGLQQLLPPTPVAASLSLTTQPASAGMRLYIAVWGQTASGSLAVTGTDPSGNAASEVISSIPVAPTGYGVQSAQVADFEWVTVQVFGAVNANGITTTGLTGGMIQIWGIPVAAFALPAIFDAERKVEKRSPNEHRGIRDVHTRLIQTKVEASVSVEQDFYADGSLWLPYMAVKSTPSVATLPATPVTLKSSAPVSTTPVSLTTQPTPPGMLLQFVLTGVGASGSISITGTSARTGQTVSETIAVPNVASQTVTSVNVYSAVASNGIAFTGMTGGTVTINGIFGYQLDFKADTSVAPQIYYSATFEFFGGTDSRVFPFTYLEEVTLEGGADKELKVTGKGVAQDDLPIGDRTNAVLNGFRTASLSQPLEIPLAGWQTTIFIDPWSNAPGTTQFMDLLDWKLTIKTGQKGLRTATNSMRYNRVYAAKREITLEATVDLTNIQEREQWRQGLRRLWQIQIIGPYIGSVSGTPLYKGWTITLPVWYESFKEEAAPTAESVTAKIGALAEFNPVLGYSCWIRAISHLPLTFATP